MKKWNFLKRWLNRDESLESPVESPPAPIAPSQEMRVLPKWIFLEFKEDGSVKIRNEFLFSVDADISECGAEFIQAPPHTKEDTLELVLKTGKRLWVRPLTDDYPKLKYVDGLLRMEEQYDWVIIQQFVEDPGRVGLTVISYNALGAWIEFSTCATIGHRFNDRILAKAVNPVLAEIIQRAQRTETRKPEVTAQIDKHIDGLIAQLGRK